MQLLLPITATLEWLRRDLRIPVVGNPIRAAQQRTILLEDFVAKGIDGRTDRGRPLALQFFQRLSDMPFGRGIMGCDHDMVDWHPQIEQVFDVLGQGQRLPAPCRAFYYMRPA